MPPALSAPLPYIELCRASPIDRIRLIKGGVPATKAKRMISDLHLDQRIMLSALNLSTATINRKA
jgi:hypothetical protein